MKDNHNSIKLSDFCLPQLRHSRVGGNPEVVALKQPLDSSQARNDKFILLETRFLIFL